MIVCYRHLDNFCFRFWTLNFWQQVMHANHWAKVVLYFRCDEVQHIWSVLYFRWSTTHKEATLCVVLHLKKIKKTLQITQQSLFSFPRLVIFCDSSQVVLRWQQDHGCRLNLHQFLLLLLGDPEVLPRFLIPAASSEPTLRAEPSWTTTPEHHS